MLACMCIAVAMIGDLRWHNILQLQVCKPRGQYRTNLRNQEIFDTGNAE